jgi:hypothetical protein
MIRQTKWMLGVVALAATLLPGPSAAQTKEDSPVVRQIVVSAGAELHYVEQGTESRSYLYTVR